MREWIGGMADSEYRDVPVRSTTHIYRGSDCSVQRNEASINIIAPLAAAPFWQYNIRAE
ncbi:MAG: hypothetical protein IKM73_05060 [Acidaminococcaceae bacterium]|nr:hypothetical protein [Acidaminococcaceae bacterium]